MQISNRKKIRLILIGLGPHAKRVYVPAFQKLKDKYPVDLCLVVELKEKENDVKDYLKLSELSPETIFIDGFEGKLPLNLKKILSEFVDKNYINAVIIATEPLAHKCYAEWAIEKGLNILMDKPITTRKWAALDMKSANGIESDYESLLIAYNKLQKKKNTAFTVNVQRRYHPGFNFVFEKLKEISNSTNCPVSSIQSMHCDGQWRLPSEIVNQHYHPYNEGYGKVSHSGYHIFDAVYKFYKSANVDGKSANEAEIVSSFIRPNGFIKQINETDYLKYFGESYKEVRQYSDTQLEEIFKNYGEIDVSSVISLLKDGIPMANISINLMHNGFARRNWITPGADLYKGNGRVKHEYHNIQQGPFQNIQIHSYQSNDKHEINTNDDFAVGGNNHFDVYVFRNIGVTGDKKPFEIFKINDLSQKYSLDTNRLVVEQIKVRVFEEFLQFMLGIISKNELSSNIDDHVVPVKLMSSVYKSHIKRLSNKNPIVKTEFNTI